MRNAHCRTWNMARKLKIMENEKYTLENINYYEKSEKHGKYGTNTVEPVKWRETLKNVENEKCSL